MATEPTHTATEPTHTSCNWRREEDAHRVVVLGGGTGGTLVANRLRRMFDAGEASIAVVDQDGSHVYQPGLLFVPFGLAHPEEIVRPRVQQLHDGIAYVQSSIDHVDVEHDVVHLSKGEFY